MIVPAVPVWPLYRFTPSRCEFESRPLREEAAPFFFDIVSPLALADPGDFDRRVVLTMTPVAALIRLVLVREAFDLRTACGADDPGRHCCAGELRRRGKHGVAAEEHHRPQRDLVAGEPFDVEPVTLGDAILLAAGLDHCIHDRNSLAGEPRDISGPAVGSSLCPSAWWRPRTTCWYVRASSRCSSTSPSSRSAARAAPTTS